MTVAHVDMDAFYASAEILDHPALRGRPVIAGGSRDGMRGVVCSASYEARRFGVRSAMPAIQARRLCPQAVFMPLRPARYEDLSRRVAGLFEETSPCVQRVSIDEAFLDLSHAGGFERAAGLARELQRRIEREVGLPASVGVARGRQVAKIASDLDKPRGFVTVEPGKERAFLAPLELRRAWGVGPRACDQLERLGLRTFGQASDAGAEAMTSVFGALGRRLWELSQGLDPTRVRASSPRDRRSLSGQSAFGRSVTTWEGLEERLLALAERVTARARRKGLLARTVTVHARSRGFRTRSRSASLAEASSATGPVYRLAAGLLRSMLASSPWPNRVGIALSRLAPDQGTQLRLFEPDGEEPSDRVDRVLDHIRGRLGRDAIHRGRLLGNRDPHMPFPHPGEEEDEGEGRRAP